jgi:lysophospholipase L1-like esterase
MGAMKRVTVALLLLLLACSPYAHVKNGLLINRTMKGILTDASLRSDQIHPNAKGYALMAERIAGPLQKLMKKAEGARH